MENDNKFDYCERYLNKAEALRDFISVAQTLSHQLYDCLFNAKIELAKMNRTNHVKNIELNEQRVHDFWAHAQLIIKKDTQDIIDHAASMPIANEREVMMLAYLQSEIDNLPPL